jgi:2-polyprenyl-3-methyl-5-hydroxy-6-metoxy-1,4-benzoquinol methylase
MMKLSFRRMFRLLREKDYSLESGERQTGKSAPEIRYDHVARYRLAADYLAENLQSRTGLFGLDIFTGTGYGAQILSERLSCTVLGMDGSGESIAFANRYFSNPRLFYSHKLFPFELPEDSFDFITCFESMEHVEEYLAFLKQIARSTKDKGFLIVSTPNERLLTYSKKNSPFHHRHFTRDEFLRIMGAFPAFHLLDWYGQNIYRMKEGRPERALEETDMDISRREEGQILIYIFVKEEKSSGA